MGRERSRDVHDMHDGSPTRKSVSVEGVEEGLGDGFEEVLGLLIRSKGKRTEREEDQRQLV